MGHCPFESRYKELYHDTAVMGAAARATTRPATPTIRPWQGCDTAKGGHDTAGCAQGRAAARTHGLASEVCRNTIRCIVTGGAARLQYGRGHGPAT